MAHVGNHYHFGGVCGLSCYETSKIGDSVCWIVAWIHRISSDVECIPLQNFLEQCTLLHCSSHLVSGFRCGWMVLLRHSAHHCHLAIWSILCISNIVLPYLQTLRLLSWWLSIGISYHRYGLLWTSRDDTNKLLLFLCRNLDTRPNWQQIPTLSEMVGPGSH